VVTGIGLIGCLMRAAAIPAAPFLMGFILGPLMEENLRRALQLSRGSFVDFLSSPIAAICFALTALALLLPIAAALVAMRRT